MPHVRGYDLRMPFKLYNTLTNADEEFVPLNPNTVSLYTCGPTVYGRPHIGNYSSFLMADLLRRWLEVSGYEVKHVKNITDVGHLVADADEGEDKVEKQAREESGEVNHDSVIGIARKYEAEYLKDEEALNMLEPFARPRASEFIDDMKRMINELLDKGIAYVTDDGIYFDIHQADDYGKLSGNSIENLCAGSRVDVNDQKKCPADFALWKFCVGANEHHVLRWDSPGTGNPQGFPGWHIECSAMSSAILGEQIDIHTGGEDNIFPHHECEIAQSECVSGKKPFVKLWLHRRRIDMGSEKMSKSLGNVLTLNDIISMGYSPMDLRYLFLSVHYRTQLKFTEKGLSDAKKARRRITEWMHEDHEVTDADDSPGDIAQAQDFIERFMAAMDADLNTPASLATVFDAMTWFRTRETSGSELMTLREDLQAMVRHTFGCFEEEEQDSEAPSEVTELLEQRKVARDARDFAESDRLRDEIKALGYEVRDDGNGQTLRKL